MNYEDTILRETIMRRVRFIHTLRTVGTPFVAKFAVFAGLIAVAGFFVSVPHVLRNMPSLFEVKSFINFAMVAFLNTKLAIQAITLGSVAVSVWMLQDIMKMLRSLPALKTAN